MDAFEIGNGSAAAIDRAQDIDKHDLPVEAGKVFAEEGPDDERLIALEAAHHHGASEPRGVAIFGCQRQRKEGEKRRACKVAGQQEPARRQRRLRTARARTA